MNKYLTYAKITLPRTTTLIYSALSYIEYYDQKPGPEIRTVVETFCLIMSRVIEVVVQALFAAILD